LSNLRIQLEQSPWLQASIPSSDHTPTNIAGNRSGVTYPMLRQFFESTRGVLAPVNQLPIFIPDTQIPKKEHMDHLRAVGMFHVATVCKDGLSREGMIVGAS
jgi:hypothetical protein